MKLSLCSIVRAIDRKHVLATFPYLVHPLNSKYRTRTVIFNFGSLARFGYSIEINENQLKSKENQWKYIEFSWFSLISKESPNLARLPKLKITVLGLYLELSERTGYGNIARTSFLSITRTMEHWRSFKIDANQV